MLNRINPKIPKKIFLTGVETFTPFLSTFSGRLQWTVDGAAYTFNAWAKVEE